MEALLACPLQHDISIYTYIYIYMCVCTCFMCARVLSTLWFVAVSRPNACSRACYQADSHRHPFSSQTFSCSNVVDFLPRTNLFRGAKLYSDLYTSDVFVLQCLFTQSPIEQEAVPTGFETDQNALLQVCNLDHQLDVVWAPLVLCASLVADNHFPSVVVVCVQSFQLYAWLSIRNTLLLLHASLLAMDAGSHMAADVSSCAIY